jgi:hypothetical protein
MPLVLREFLYLDNKLTQEFLAQLEGGVFNEEAQRELEQRGKSLGGEAGVSALGTKAGVQAGRRSGGEEETERTVQQTPESAFARLVDLLTDQQALQWLEVVDEAIWEQLRRGELIEAEAVVRVSSLVRFMTLAQGAAPLMELLESIGEETLDEEGREAMSMFSMLGQVVGNSVPIVAPLAGSPDYKLLASLQPENLRVAVDLLDGDATVLAKIHRKLRPDERHTAIDLIPGIRAFPEAQRREFAEGMENTPDAPDMVIEPPAAHVTVVPIYR